MHRKKNSERVRVSSFWKYLYSIIFEKPKMEREIERELCIKGDLWYTFSNKSFMIFIMNDFWKQMSNISVFGVIVRIHLLILVAIWKVLEIDLFDRTNK